MKTDEHYSCAGFDFEWNAAKSEEWHKAESSPQVELKLRIDEESFAWLESESKRTGIGIDAIASAVMRRACFEGKPVGAPDNDRVVR